jgi:hypothetical protein
MTTFCSSCARPSNISKVVFSQVEATTWHCTIFFLA